MTTGNQPPPSGMTTGNQPPPSGVSTDNQTDEQPGSKINDHTQFE